jgi:hypothetical protein
MRSSGIPIQRSWWTVIAANWFSKTDAVVVGRVSVLVIPVESSEVNWVDLESEEDVVSSTPLSAVPSANGSNGEKWLLLHGKIFE